jgi:lipopolysaccharide/colanic/teichoic acid biosynthesis glycosyltransferase
VTGDNPSLLTLPVRPEHQSETTAAKFRVDLGAPVDVDKTTIYLRCGKRLIDASLSFVAIVLLCPLFAIVGMMIKWTSPGPILYWQDRVGRGGRIFKIAKFRSMVVGADKNGLGITVSGDARVTRFGAFLRKSKIDEFPQLWNVLKGEMSLVGPRPELPQYVSAYTPEQRLVLQVRPGITDPASIRYRHEEAVLAMNPNPDKFYRHVILPDKLAINIQYIRDISMYSDIKCVIQTMTSLFKQPTILASEPIAGKPTRPAVLSAGKKSRTQ